MGNEAQSRLKGREAVKVSSHSPFEKGTGSTAVLLLHGLTGTPDEVEPLGRALCRKYKVLIPWLPGHGTSPESLKNVGWRDWVCAAEKAFDHLAKRSTRVYVGGLSMGACLALQVGLSRPAAGIISMAAPIHIQDWRYRGLAIFRFLQWKTRELTGGVRDIEVHHETYPWCPTQSLYELKKLADFVRPGLSSLTAPLLILQGRQDSMVSPFNAQYLYESVGSKQKYLRWMEKSDHVLPLDLDHQKVTQTVERFIASHGKTC